MSRSARMGVPPRRKEVFYIYSPAALETFKFTVYSQTIEPVYTHWDGKGTVPCYVNRELCQPKHTILSLRWKGYLFGYHHGCNEASFLQLTHEAANQLLDQLGEATSLRGMILQTSRTKKKNGRQNCRVLHEFGSADPRTLPRELSARLSLFNMWKLEPNSLPWTTALDLGEETNGPTILRA